MSKSSKKFLDAKLLKEARAYIPNILRVCINDCSDSGHEADKHEARFNALADDKIGIAPFIKEHLWAEWRAALLETLEGRSLEELIQDGWPVTEPPVPLDDLTLIEY